MNMLSSRISRFAPVTVAALIAFAGFVVAGPLNPPAGPVTSTMKTMTEVEPRISINATNTPGDADSVFRISQPGSYYLTGNVNGIAGKRTIELATNGVTIDLNGYSLIGVTGSLEAIGNDRAIADVSIVNGTITRFPDRGINLTSYARVNGARIERVSFYLCGTVGLQASMATHVDSCTFESCPSAMTATTGAIVRNSTFASFDVQGVGVDAGSIVEGCNFQPNSEATSIALLGAGSVRHCSITGGTTGISASANSVIEGNHVRDTYQQAIWGQSGCRIVRNHVTNASGAGIRQDGNYAEISDNTVSGSRFSAANDRGIHIFVTATRNLIRGNTISDCDVGIEVAAGGNAIYANALTSNSTHFNVVAANRVGPIATGALSPAINGSTGGSGMGSTDPFANIIY